MGYTEKKSESISVVIPLFNEEESLPGLYAQLKSVLERLNKQYEIIFVDDGSRDGSFSVLESFHKENKRIKVVQFRRNFGKAAALSAGFKYAKGDVIITMDADLQDNPEEIPNFLNKLKEDYDLVLGWRFKRKDSVSKILPSKLFNHLTSVLTRVSVHDFNCGFKAYRREVVREIDLYGELHRYTAVLAHWRGYKVGEIRIRHYPRAYGRSKYGAERLFRGLVDLVTVVFLTRYVRRPLHLFGAVGVLLLLAGLMVNVYLAVLRFLGQGIGTRPLLLLGILLMVIGFQIISTGLIGEMIVSTRDRDKEPYRIKKVLE